MRDPQPDHLDECLNLLGQGTLTEPVLRRLFASAQADDGKRQDLLYLQLASSSVHAEAIGMTLIERGQTNDDFDQKPWPYQSVAAAISDGWRVIQFPNLALKMDPAHPVGLGFEFVLERWR